MSLKNGTSGAPLRSTLFIHKLKLKVNLGVSDKERSAKQFILLDIALRYDRLPKLAITDDIKDGCCYEEIILLAKQFSSSKQYKLVEHFAFGLYKFLKAKYADNSLNIKIYKKPKIKDFNGEICFECGDF